MAELATEMDELDLAWPLLTLSLLRDAGKGEKSESCLVDVEEELSDEVAEQGESGRMMGVLSPVDVPVMEAAEARLAADRGAGVGGAIERAGAGGKTKEDLRESG